MLDKNPTTRIGFCEILTHPVFAHLDWDTVADLGYTREFAALLRLLDVMVLIFASSNVDLPREEAPEGTEVSPGGNRVCLLLPTSETYPWRRDG